MEVSCHLYAPTALSPGKSSTFSLDRRLGGAQNQPERCPGIRSRFLSRLDILPTELSCLYVNFNSVDVFVI
jgi:hypothetical protein